MEHDKTISDKGKAPAGVTTPLPLHKQQQQNKQTNETLKKEE